jgi:hypothetical protein
MQSIARANSLSLRTRKTLLSHFGSESKLVTELLLLNSPIPIEHF